MRENQQRTSITNANTWVAITIPVGATNFLLGVEDSTGTFRISIDNSLDPSSQGMYIAATGLYGHEGTTTSELTIYISASSITTAILQYN